MTESLICDICSSPVVMDENRFLICLNDGIRCTAQFGCGVCVHSDHPHLCPKCRRDDEA